MKKPQNISKNLSVLSKNSKIGYKSGFREVFAKQKFGKIQQEFSSKSLLCGETASRPTEGTVNFSAVIFVWFQKKTHLYLSPFF